MDLRFRIPAVTHLIIKICKPDTSCETSEHHSNGEDLRAVVHANNVFEAEEAEHDAGQREDEECEAYEYGVGESEGAKLP